MDFAQWTAAVYPEFRQQEGAPAVWELFHENSKTTRYSKFPDAAAVVERVRAMHPSIEHPTLPAVALPEPSALREGLDSLISGRRSARELAGGPLSLADLSALVASGYGVTLPKGEQRGFRATPSGGALYPLELYVVVQEAGELDAGLYHFEPERNLLRRLAPADEAAKFAAAFVQEEVVAGAPMLLLITAVFERSIFKYGERGYRFALIEAGHVAQNIILAATALGCASVSLGGYFDHEVDELLEIDGVTHSTVYALAVGGAKR